MATQFTHYASTDGSAPVLTGTAGDLVNLLDKCLVTGYGAKSAAGWAKTYSATNKAAFTQGSGSNGMLLRVRDDAGGAGGAKEAQVTGYETMSDVDTGTGPFPTAAQGIGGAAYLMWRKSATADSTARAWHVFADSRTVYIFIASGDISNVYWFFRFGEFYSTVSSDSYRCMISGRIAENSGGAGGGVGGHLSTSIITTTAGHFVARGHAGTGGSITTAITGDASKGPANNTMSGLVPYTNPADGGLYLSPIWISDTTSAPLYGIRGRLRGLWHFLHAHTSVADGDTVTGVGDLSGKTFRFIRIVYDSNANSGVAVVETSNTVEAN